MLAFFVLAIPGTWMVACSVPEEPTESDEVEDAKV